MTNRVFRILLAALVLLAVCLQVSSVRDEAATFDEDVDITAGYVQWKTGNPGFIPEHPPLPRLIASAPLLWLGLDLQFQPEVVQFGDLYSTAEAFLYRNRQPAATILFAARSTMIAVTALLLLLIALWGRAKFGPVPALFATALAAFDPNLLAHGRYTTTDILTAPAALVAIAAWVRYLETRRARDLIWPGLAMGLALSIKHSLLMLVVVYIAVYALRAWRDDTLSLDRFFGSMIAVGALALVVVAIPYGRWPTGPLSAHPYLAGLHNVIDHNQTGHPAYLLGQLSMQGWWYYYPVAFAVKTPTGALLLLAAASAFALRGLRRLRSAPLAPCALAITAILCFTGACASHIDIGLRYVLLIYPLLYVLAATCLWNSGRAGRVLLAAGLVLQVAECARIHPYYTAFFNTLSGGPARGSEYLVDSNIDWGQDLFRLKRYMDAQHETSPCLLYFGKPDPKLIYSGWSYLPRTHETARRAEMNCLAAISVTLLRNAYVDPGSYTWLWAYKPVARVGYSINVYDFRRRK